MAVRRWAPLATVVVFQDIEYGEDVFSAPKFAPSSRNWTPATPTLSEAVAETVTEPPDTVLPDPGALIATVGGVVSDAGGGVLPLTIAIGCVETIRSSYHV